MKEFLTDFTEEELKSCIAKAYDSKFDTEEIAPLAKVEDAYYLENSFSDFGSIGMCYYGVILLSGQGE